MGAAKRVDETARARARSIRVLRDRLRRRRHRRRERDGSAEVAAAVKDFGLALLVVPLVVGGVLVPCACIRDTGDAAKGECRRRDAREQCGSHLITLISGWVASRVW